jgi:FtsX-like permease family
MRVAWYRCAATFGRRWGGYLTLALLIGLIGGIAMGSVAAARRTQSSYATFLAATNPSDLGLSGQGPNLTRELARLPGVQRVEAALYSLNAFPLTPTGAPIIPPAFRFSQAIPIGSIDGEYFDQDRVTVTAGRMGRPDQADEFVATALAARLLGWHVGQIIALEPGRGRTAVPVRSVLFGAALAVAIVVATLTFGSGLTTLVSHPPLYGWNWSYVLEGPDVPPQTRALLDRDSLVAAWTGVSFADLEVDGEVVPAIVTDAHARVSPPMLSGHRPDRSNQLVLGAQTLAQLHERVGDTVDVSYGAPGDAPAYIPPTREMIVGTATLPAIGGAQTLHTSMGTGALITNGIAPPALRKALQSPDPTLNGPTAVLVRLKNGVTPAAGQASLQHIARAGTRAFEDLPSSLYTGQSVEVLPVQYPAEIENYRSIGATPALLASGLAVGAVIALGLTLIASVRRRRRDLAMLKTLGLTRHQLASCVAWQATVAVTVGVVAGIPAGVALGRWLWILFAQQIYAVPEPTVPALSLCYVGLGALMLANLVAVLPGRHASRTPVALVLRTE